jgi:hypothetical protein
MMAWLSAAVMANDQIALSGLPDSGIPYVAIAHLESNPLNRGRTVAWTDRATGLAQIKALLSRTNFEEQWAFIPAANLWIEIGRNEVATGKDSSVELDLDFLTRLAAVYDEIHILHFHPASYYKQGRWADTHFDINYPARRLRREEILPIGLALPSSADVASSVQLVELLSEENLQTSLHFTVVSPHGQVSYGPTEIGVQNLIFNRGNPRLNFVREIAVRAILRRTSANIQRSIENMPSLSIGGIIAELCKQMSGEDYRLTFSPVTQFQSN